MTNVQRQKLYGRLMQGLPEQLERGSPEWRAFDESTVEDLNALEPLIDEFLMEAFEKGKADAISKFTPST